MKNETRSTDANATPEPVTNTGEGITNSQQTADIEQLAAENRELKNTIRLANARETAITKLKDLGARSPELLFGAVSAKLHFDEEGNAGNISQLLAEIKGLYPEQFETAAAASIDAGASANGSRTMLTAADLRRMSATEIARLDWAEVRRILANN